MRRTVLTVCLLTAVAIAQQARAPEVRYPTVRFLRATPEHRSHFGAAFLAVVNEVVAAFGEAGLACEHRPVWLFASSSLQPGQSTLDEDTPFFVSPTGTRPITHAKLECRPVGADGGSGGPFSLDLEVAPDGDAKRPGPGERRKFEGPHVVASGKRGGSPVVFFVGAGRTPNTAASPVLRIESSQSLAANTATVGRALERPRLLRAIAGMKPLVLTAPAAAERPHAFSPDAQAAEEQRVLESLSKETFGGNRFIVTEAVGPLVQSWTSVLRVLPDLRASLFENYEARCAQPTLPSLPPSFRYVSGADFAKAVGVSIDWSKFRSSYPGFRAHASLSPIGFSADGTQAMLYMSWLAGPLEGGASTYLLVKTNEAWHVTYELHHLSI